MNTLGFFYFMPMEYWVIMAIAAIPSFFASLYVKSKFAHYSKIATSSGVTGARAARAVLDAAGLRSVAIERYQGFLSDHYDPRAKVLRLSPQVHDGNSVSSVAVAAHEAGHALQDAAGYAPLRFRSALVPVATIGNSLWMLPFMLGLFTGLTSLIYVSIALFGGLVLFQLVTLPTEFDASRRAKVELVNVGVVNSEAEARGVSSVLTAAAMTYVAGALAAILQLLYLLMIASSRGSRD